jgi:hypothetical protein
MRTAGRKSGILSGGYIDKNVPLFYNIIVQILAER